MRTSTIREFGERRAALHANVLLCTQSNAAERLSLSAGMIVGIDEEHDAPIVVDLLTPSGVRYLCSAPQGAQHLVHPRGGEFFEGEDLGQMRPGQWTWAREATDDIGSTRPPPPPPPPGVKQASKRR